MIKLKKFTLIKKKINIFFSLENIIFSAFSVFLYHSKFYYIMPFFIVFQTYLYTLVRKQGKNKTIIDITFLFPLVIVFLIVFYLDHMHANF